MKLTLVDGWQHFWKWSSIHLNILATAVTSWLLIWPDSAYTIWLNFPQSVKAMLPEHFVVFIGVAIYVVSMVARLVTTSKAKERAREQAARKAGNAKNG